MSVSQIRASFQNDGNFSQLDLQNAQDANNLIMRIETFRTSQPVGRFGKTSAGTDVTALAGKDHLTTSSNKTFRHVFSAGRPNNLTALIEMRETFDAEGPFTVILRDIDGRSDSFGSAVIASTKPTAGEIAVNYKFSDQNNLTPQVLKSPLQGPLTEKIDGLIDIADIADSTTVQNEIAIDLSVSGENSDPLAKLTEFSASIQEKYPQWTRNVQLFTRMGDFRDKTIHPGTNLVFTTAERTPEFVSNRAYRGSLIMAGRLFDPAMSAGASQVNRRNPLELDTKPGVYSVFLSAFSLNIGLYQLGLDKVHSDYSGVPLALKPGSRLENGIDPTVDSTNFNKLLAVISAIYYAPDALPSIIKSHSSIMEFSPSHALALLASRT